MNLATPNIPTPIRTVTTTSPPAQLASSSRDPFSRNHQAQFAWIAHLATVLLLG